MLLIVTRRSLFYKLVPDKSLTVDKNDCKGGRKSKERYTVMLCTKWMMKSVVIGGLVIINYYYVAVCIFIYVLDKSYRPRRFKKLDIKKLPVLWYSNRKFMDDM